MQSTGPTFTRPQNPAAKCLNLVRLNPICTRSELMEATGLSQPTITRAVTALLNAGLLHERTDLTRSQGRGRPTVPLELTENDWIFAGIAIGTRSTYIAIYDCLGRVLRDADFELIVSQLDPEDWVHHIMAGVNKLTAGLQRPLVSVGVTGSGSIDAEGRVHAANLGWSGLDIKQMMHYQFQVPITVAPAVASILGSETQASDFTNTERVLVFFADDSLGAVLGSADEVSYLDTTPADGLVHSAVAARIAAGEDERAVLDERARGLAEFAADLVTQHHPDTIVIAGGAFYDDAQAPKLFASRVRELAGPGVALRMIPNHRHITRAIARAVALDPLLRDPLSLGR